MSEPSISILYKQARARGFDPAVSTHILLKYVADAPRSGRLKVGGDDEGKLAIVNVISKDRYGREKTLDTIALDVNLSASTVQRGLKEMGYHKRKPSRKPGLTLAMRKARLDWCLAHRHWGLRASKM
jgi:AraC-like DNA-binding protein